MQLSVQKREPTKKKDPKRLRRAGVIPAVLYGQGKDSQSISVDTASFQAHLRKMPQGRLSTTIFNLKGTDGIDVRAIVKDIQYHVVTYDILHLDFEVLTSGKNVTLNVPVALSGVVDCVGVKQGGVLRQALRYIRLTCPSDEIPSVFMLDVKDLAQEQSVKVSDIKVSPKTRVLTPHGEIVVMIAKK